MLRTAKEQGVVDYESDGLREDGRQDDVVITLLTDQIPDSDETTCSSASIVFTR